MSKTTGFFIVLAMLCGALTAQQVTFNDAWSAQGFTLTDQSSFGVDIDFSIESMLFSEIEIDGQVMTNVSIPGVMLPNEEGAPNLPGDGRWIALPEGAKPQFTITASRVETYRGVDIAPAPRIPLETEDGLEFTADRSIYNTNAFYPASPVVMSDPTELRGVDAAILGITPFQYNPVTRELLVYRDLKVRVDFIGGNGHFGEDRLRSKWWDPILKGALLNFESLPEVAYPVSRDRWPDYEYIILTPDETDYLVWADSLSKIRNKQGVATGVVTTTEIGGNTASNIENFIDDAYDDWDVPPVAVLILGDYGTGAGQITSPVWSNYCISDNFYADVSGNDLPDVALSRMTANNADQLAIMMEKAINYEYDPPTDPGFYSNPVIAGGWQTERWFILCTEVVFGFLENELNKTPVREYAIYSGSPSGSWSTNTNTSTIVNFFGPDGLGYIPATPSGLTDWGGNATRINEDLNSGAFMMLHRDHGGEDGWGEPDYDINDLDGLDGNPPVFVFSINCLTGKFNYGGECFAEAFHRYEDRALGIIAATEVSYSFVNDTYVWGMMDLMWPEFNPEYGANGPHNLMPGFANAYGKVFLAASSWPYNQNNKEVTYYLFHHHGDGFCRLYEEVPQQLTVDHLDVLPCGLDFFEVTADAGADICLSVNGQIIGTAVGTGAPQDVTIDPQFPPAYVDITVTMQNYERYETSVLVVPLDAPFLIHDGVEIVDANGNNDDILDYSDGNVSLSLTVENVGEVAGSGITFELSTTDSFVTLTDDEETGVSTPGEDFTTLASAFSFDIASNVPDSHVVAFEWTATDGEDVWDGDFSLIAHAPILELGGFVIDDSAGGDGNGRMDAGETADLLVTIRNVGSSGSFAVEGEILTNDLYTTINTGQATYGDIDAEGQAEMAFSITAADNAPVGHMIEFDLDIDANYEYASSGEFHFPIGQIPVLILDWDTTHASANAILSALDDNNVSAQMATELPEDLELFTSVFACLGVLGNNHVLTNEEAEALESFLLQGGKLYMEGGDTWYNDAQTVLHPYFHINSSNNGSGNLGPVIGQAGSIAAGMNFGYTGNNTSIDQLTPVSPGVAVFRNYSPSFACMISYDEGNYQTIGGSMCFGNLINGVYSKTELMANILDFFNIVGTPMGNVYGSVTLNPTGDVSSVDISIDGFIIHPNDDGEFSVDLAPGEYDFEVSCENYMPITEAITLEEYDELERNWTLNMMAAPQNLTVELDGAEATLSWDAVARTGRIAQNAGSRDFLNYSIYFQTLEMDDPELLAETEETTYVDEPTWNTVTYYYVVAEYDEGSSENSNMVEVTLLAAPANLVGVTQSYDAVLTWDAPSMPARLEFNKYTIYRDDEVAVEITDFETVTWTDVDLDVGEYEYFITAMWGEYESAASNTAEVTILSGGTNVEPFVTAMGMNYPNPFNPETTIPFSLADDREVEITIYNILGQTVRTYDLGVMESGNHTLVWRGKDMHGASVASGIYFVRMQAGDYVEVRKAILMK